MIIWKCKSINYKHKNNLNDNLEMYIHKIQTQKKENENYYHKNIETCIILTKNI